MKNAEQQARAQLSSIVDMVVALECDYSRLEDLREMKCNFAAGWNMPGYMPDDAPGNFADFDEAREFIVDGLLSAVELVDDSAENAAALIADLNFTKEYVENQTGEFSIKCGNLVYRVTTAHQFGLDDYDFEELNELEAAAGDCADEDDAREQIEQDALSVEIRSDWYTPGEESEPAEYKILLCTGGPAVRIIGELDQYNQPATARLQYKDWFTPWTELVDHSDHGALFTYAQQFYFGE